MSIDIHLKSLSICRTSKIWLHNQQEHKFKNSWSQCKNIFEIKWFGNHFISGTWCLFTFNWFLHQFYVRINFLIELFHMYCKWLNLCRVLPCPFDITVFNLNSIVFNHDGLFISNEIKDHDISDIYETMIFAWGLPNTTRHISHLCRAKFFISECTDTQSLSFYEIISDHMIIFD